MRATVYVSALLVMTGLILWLNITTERRYKRQCIADCVYLKAFKEPAQCEWACMYAVK